jgi:hypothetical protein
MTSWTTSRGVGKAGDSGVGSCWRAGNTSPAMMDVWLDIQVIARSETALLFDFLAASAAEVNDQSPLSGYFTEAHGSVTNPCEGGLALSINRTKLVSITNMA